MKVWIGKEKEGKFKGLKTLFIGDYNITLKQIEDITSNHFFEQVYFGAGRCTKINQNLVKEVLENFPLCIVTLEVDINSLNEINTEYLNDNRVELILTITNKNFIKLKDVKENKIQIKTQTLGKEDYITLCQYELFDRVNEEELLGKTYEGDEVLIK